jgi:hypothetical protein
MNNFSRCKTNVQISFNNKIRNFSSEGVLSFLKEACLMMLTLAILLRTSASCMEHARNVKF